MRMNQKVALMTSAGLVAFLGACADSATAPSARDISRDATLAVAGTTAGITTTAVPSEIRVCKVGNVAGTFTVSRTNVTSTGFTIVGAAYVVQPGTCAVVLEDDSPSGSGSQVTVTETSAGLQSIAGVQTEIGGPQVALVAPANGAGYFINSIHGIRLTFTNNVVTGGCTYTKGWYRNHGSSTVTAVDGRTKAEAQAIFDATPGQPGSVTWQGDNNTLNLYQQLLAALLNGGASGPASVQTAIANAQAATGGTGLNITLVAGTDVGALITPLSNFNEGNVANFPHCD